MWKVANKGEVNMVQIGISYPGVTRAHSEVFELALKNATPLVEVKARRIGGATYQVPTDLRSNRSEALAMRWIIRGARGRAGMPMRRGLANELMEASRGEGSAVRRREELHRMAEANRAFVNFRR